MMDRVCKACQSTNFSIENFETVCTTCGEVQEDFPTDDGDLKMVPDGQTMLDNLRDKKHDAYDRLTKRIRGETTCPDIRRQISRKKLLDDMRRAVKQLIKDPGAIEETMDLVSETFRANQSRLLTSRKYGLVGACVYYLSAKHQLGISLADISKEFNIKLKVLSACLKQVKSLCPNFEYERPNMRDLVKKFVDDIATKHYDLASLESAASPMKRPKEVQRPQQGGETQPLIDRSDKTVLENRVMLLIDLFEAMHPYNQPSPQSMITAVIYYAWISLDTFKLIALNLKSRMQNPHATNSAEVLGSETDAERLQRRVILAKQSIGYEKFCQLSNLKYSSNGHKIVSKLQSSLLELGKHLGDVNKMNLPWFLKDIIDNSAHLIQEHLRSDGKADGTSLANEQKQRCDAELI